jgi:regulator of sirC expression with transglutaminase-like and TPR domain
MDFPLARQRFYQEIHQPDEQINLAKAALYLAQEEYPDLDPEAYLGKLDAIAQAIQARLPGERYPLKVVQTINQYLYEELGFSGNTDDYYDPRNSYFNDVIDRRKGIPLTLSLLYLEVASRIDFPMVGVGMPGHFVVRPVVKNMEIFIDPFNQGEVLFPEDCEARLTEVFGQPVDLRPEFLEPVDAYYFLARMLTNLKAIYLSRKDINRALSMIERILLIFPDAPMEQRDRGLIYYELERWAEAIPDLENYLSQMPMAQDAEFIRQVLQTIKTIDS